MSLHHHCHRLEQDAQDPQVTVDLDRVLRLDPPLVGHKAVDLLDPPLGVAAVRAHIPFAHRAVRARNGIRTPNDPHHEIAHLEPTRTRVEYPAKRLVAEDQALPIGRRPSV